MALNKAYKSEWSKISDAKLVKIILDEHATCPPKISNCIKVLMIRLIRRTDENFLDLIQSSDPSIRKLNNVKSNIKKWFQLIFKNIKLIYY
jgi:hypothetical protein